MIYKLTKVSTTEGKWPFGRFFIENISECVRRNWQFSFTSIGLPWVDYKLRNILSLIHSIPPNRTKHFAFTRTVN